MNIYSFGYRISILESLAQKKCLKNKFQDPEFVTANNKNAIETPFFAILSPQKGMEGFVIDM